MSTFRSMLANLPRAVGRLGVLAALVILAPGCKQEQKQNLPGEKVRDFANILYNRELYQQAVAEYQRYLEHYPLDEEEQANISFTIANIYFDRLRNYESALAYYLRVKELYPRSGLVDDAGRRIIECLERLQRSADAQQALAESTLLDTAQVTKKRPGEVVAKIGNREITSGDLEFEIKNLPPFVLAQIKNRNDRLEFLRQYIATELLYGTAKRKGLERDQEVIDAAFQAKKNFMVQKLLQEEVAQKVDFQESDLELYYRANLDRYAPADSTGATAPPAFQEVRNRVMQDYVRAKQQEAYDRLVERMMRAEGVVIYDDKVQ